MATTTPNLLIGYVLPSQNNKETTLNQALSELDTALTQLLSIAMADANVVLTTGEGNQALGNMVFIFTGSNTAARTVQVPTNKKFYVVSNQTTGGFKITVKTASGTGIDILSTDGYVFLYCDGTNVVKAGGSGAGGGVGGVNAKSADYTLQAGDLGKNVVLTSGNHNFTVPSPPPSTSWFAFILNENPGVSPGILTVLHNGLSMNGVTADVTLSSGEGIVLFTDGTNYFYLSCGGGSGGSSTLAGLADVLLSGLSDGQVLTYESASSRWKNKAGFSNPMTTSGDTIYGGASGTPTRLAKGSDGQVLTLASGVPSWAAGGGGGGTAFQSIQRRTRVTVDGVTTTFQVVGDVLPSGDLGTKAAIAASSTSPAAIEVPPSGGPGQLSMLLGPNYVAGRHLKWLFRGYLTTTGDNFSWMGIFAGVGNILTFFRGTTPGGSSGSNYVAFRCQNKSGSSSETTWHACCGDGASDTATDTGITQDANPHSYAIVMDDDNNQILYYIDGALVATNTTHRPTTGSVMTPYWSNWFSSTTYNLGFADLIIDSDM